MLAYNLTQRERQIVLDLIRLSQNSKEHFDARILHPGVEGPTGELTRLDFGNGNTAEVTKRDLRLLKDEGLIYFRWYAADHGMGRLSSLAFEATGNDFQVVVPVDAVAIAALALEKAEAADEEAIALRFAKLTLELVALARTLIDADEAVAAQNEAKAIAAELRKEQPDETIVIRKTKGFVSRLALTFSGRADLAAKGEQIGEFGERLAAWLVALSIWTEWHALHHPAPDPCA